MKTRIKNYLSVTKTEWNGLIILLLLIVAVLIAPYVYNRFYKEQPVNFKRLEIAVAQLKKAGVTGDIPEEEGNRSKVPLVLFKFKPNNLPAAQWQKLGLTERQIKGIKNYEAKGGRFYTKADVKKMYTLTADDYKRLEPYIDLPASNYGDIKPLTIVELNTADSAKLTRLKGIGPAFARRIVQYRKRLGGYHSKQQLKEVFGIDDMQYRDIQAQFTVNVRKLKKININAAEYDDLKNFPYLSYKQMNAVIQYRKQHGDYETFDELSNVAILDEAVLKKIKPYIVLK
ncbi:helix-hairpin-helix domain-containing protein [Mucilaginibacter terrae]|uniref:Competence protein ComEA n=1 Tax=Mucilaginibacter terrae TaxID=1955052 RepID=A0ABU3GY44_9SPHI|nr:helix-hairpin-helix domain-containing protein [Mucilaginibacter terrae]MDT3404516.1 competence protein ComEA [Mucilaginibacter terrae]